VRSVRGPWVIADRPRKSILYDHPIDSDRHGLRWGYPHVAMGQPNRLVHHHRTKVTVRKAPALPRDRPVKSLAVEEIGMSRLRITQSSVGGDRYRVDLEFEADGSPRQTATAVFGFNLSEQD